MVARYKGPIIDLDVHHRARGDNEVLEYLPKVWREYATANRRRPQATDPAPTAGFETLSNLARRADAFPEDGGPPGSSYERLKTQLLDRHNYARAVLTHDVGDFSCHLNPYWAAAVCSAINDWNIDHWLSLDDRLCSLIVVPLATPELAVAEIKRLGGYPTMAGVLLAGSPLGRPFGDPIYHPVYEAAAEMGLALSIHPAGSDRPDAAMRGIPAPGLTVFDFVTLQSQQAQHHIASFIVHGVFEKYPGLHVVVKECGVAWLPSLIWRLDQRAPELRAESPWVRRSPSEYIHDHIKLTTQPIEKSDEESDGLARLLQAVDGMEDLLCFSTDYPHITFDDPNYVARQLPRGWEEKVFYGNACSTYGWDAQLATGSRSEAPAHAQGTG